MLINLWVRDKLDGTIHQVGTDVHDSLEFIDGNVEYENMQNCCGTSCDEEYEWVEPPDLDDYISVTPDELYFYRKEIIDKAFRVAKFKAWIGRIKGKIFK